MIKRMKPIAHLVLFLAASLLLCVTSAAQGGSPGAGFVSPAGGMGGADEFGRLIDVSGDRVIVADGTEVRIYNTLTQSFEAEDLLADAFSDPVVHVFSVSIEGDYAAVCAVIEVPPFGAHTYRLGFFEFVESEWTLRWSDVAALRAVIHGERVFSVEPSFGTSAIRVRDFDQNLTPLINFGGKQSQLIAFAVGDGPTPTDPTRLLVTLEHQLRTREVLTLRVDGFELVDWSSVAAAPDDGEFGIALAVDDGWVCISAPDVDGVAPQAGRLDLWRDFGDGELMFSHSIQGESADAHWGRALDMDGPLLAFSTASAPLLGSSDAGSVRVARRDGDTWSLTSEIHHSLDTANAFGFGVSVALDGTQLAVGEPREESEAGSAWWRPLPVESVFANELVPGIAGLDGVVPKGSALGASFAGAAFRVDVRAARPFAPAFVVVGLSSVSLPFKTGVLFPSPDLILARRIDSAGELSVRGRWPDTRAQELTLALQVFVQDVDAPAGFAATPGFSAEQF